MTFLRKIAFVTFSIAAFVYLVLQTTQGQRWLNETRTSLFSADPPPELLTFDVTTDQMLSDKFQQLLSNSSHISELQNLQNQLQQMQSNIADLRAELSRVRDGDELAAVAVSNVVTASPIAINLQKSARGLEQVKVKVKEQRMQKQQVQEQGQQIAQTPTFTRKHTDSRQRQLEQQAKLQEVVQRMELTALQAISR